MIAFEVAFIFVIAIVAVVSLATIGSPLAKAYAEKLKTQYKAIGSQEAYSLKEHLRALEGEILDLKSQMKVLQESNEYMTKYLELKRKD